MDPYECLVNINTNGVLNFYGIGESKFKNKVLIEKQYMTESMTKHMEAFPVTAAKFDKESQILLLGDEFGNIEGWLLSEFVEALMLTKVEKSVLSRRRDNKSSIHVPSFLS